MGRRENRLVLASTQNPLSTRYYSSLTLSPFWPLRSHCLSCFWQSMSQSENLVVSKATQQDSSPQTDSSEICQYQLSIHSQLLLHKGIIPMTSHWENERIPGFPSLREGSLFQKIQPRRITEAPHSAVLHHLPVPPGVPETA